MNRTILRVAVKVAISLTALPGLLACSQRPVISIADPTSPPTPAAQVDAFLRREMQERRIPGLQVAVVQHQQIVLLKSFGFANLQDSVRVTNRSVFPLNSCTKAFTGVALLQLVEEGKVDLAAPVSRYLNGLSAAWQPVTIRQLLTHVSGLPDINRLLNPVTHGLQGVGTEGDVWAKLQTLPLDFPTGEQFSYNQTNYYLLGKIIDKLRGKPFAQTFRERQFQVVGMPNTHFGDSRDIVPRMAQTYRYATNLDGNVLRESQLVHNYAEFPQFHRTASGLNSTAEDVAHWLIALQQGKLFETTTALTTLWTAGTYKNGTPTQWALGWVTKPRLTHSAVIATGGGRAALFVYPADELSVVVLTNLAGAYPEDFIDELAGYYKPSIPAADPITRLRRQLRQRGFDHALEIVAEEKKKDASFLLAETDLNDWAYRLLANGQTTQALGVFQVAVSLYPASWNAYDSYGEALAKDGQKEKAIAMYKKSIELNPNNLNGKKFLDRLLK
ncbi:serine hydrolase [uncultured Hymenobacter sp.]|uniref:serine hydrolase n=1 Tax=uncultured Hymenobacter sp. TaxID=170016 RepID=UPI0035C9521A